MVRGPDGDTFRAEWLVVALRALLAGETERRSATIGIKVDDELIGLRVTSRGVEVHAHEDEHHDAVVRAEPSVVLELAAGMLTFDKVAALIMVDGDQSAVRAAFDPKHPSTSDTAR
jgi:hypothetical protein